MENIQKRIMVVIGMHRSGTSLITKSLSVLGVKLGDRLLPPANDNPQGFFEDIDINALNIDMLQYLDTAWHNVSLLLQKDIELLRRQGYVSRAVNLVQTKIAKDELFGVKDPRMAKLLSFWGEVFADIGNLKASYVIVIRHPMSVSESLTKRDGFETERSFLLWLEYTVNCLVYVNKNFDEAIVVDYDRFMASPKSEIYRISKGLNLNVDLPELDKFICEFMDIELRHTYYTMEDLSNRSSIFPLVFEVYETLLKVASDSEQLTDDNIRKKITQWEKEIYRMRYIFKLIDSIEKKASKIELDLAARVAELSVKLQRSLVKIAIGVSKFNHFVKTVTSRM